MIMSDSYTKDKLKILQHVWNIVPEKLQATLIVLALIFTALTSITIIANEFFDFRSNFFSGEVAGYKTDFKSENPAITSVSKNPNGNLCYTDWVDFSSDLWEGLSSKYSEVNGVYTLSGGRDKLSNVAYYIKPCKGGIKTELDFISFAEKLINLDLYYGNQFRWEIGGNDLRSVKLYKNGTCTPNWSAFEVETEFKYLPKGVRVAPAQPVAVSMLVFHTIAGKLRTELHLKFTPLSSSESREFNDLFFYEFEVGSECNSKTAKNIDHDYERVGVELVSSSYNSAELPKIKFNRFRVGPYLPNN